jgi:hypothetical protein
MIEQTGVQCASALIREQPKSTIDCIAAAVNVHGIQKLR